MSVNTEEVQMGVQMARALSQGGYLSPPHLVEDLARDLHRVFRPETTPATLRYVRAAAIEAIERGGGLCFFSA